MKTKCTKCGHEADGRYCTRCGFSKRLYAAESVTAVSRVELRSPPSQQPAVTPDEHKPAGQDSGNGNGHHEIRWEYKHVFMPTAKAVELHEGSEKATRTQVRSYKAEKIEKELQALGDDGWEVVSMEPHWFWERSNGHTSPETARPKAITGWYCTFKRPFDPARMALN